MTVIKHFVNKFNYVYTSACSQKNIRYIPFPKYTMSTEKLVKEYDEVLDKFIRGNKLKNPEKYEFKKVPQKFPNEYFNYEST